MRDRPRSDATLEAPGADAPKTDASKKEGARPERARRRSDSSKTEANAEPPSLAALAEDWIALWQDELTALATDREIGENWQSLVGAWSRAAQTWFSVMNFGTADEARADRSRRSPPAEPPTSRDTKPKRAARAKGAAPAAAAPDVRDAEIERLHRHVGELERRLADIERRAGKPATHRRIPKRLGGKR